MGNARNEKMNSNNAGHAKTMMHHGSFGWRMLKRVKIVDGTKYQLHATRGWKKV
jgi:hypothetical protein